MRHHGYDLENSGEWLNSTYFIFGDVDEIPDAESILKWKYCLHNKKNQHIVGLYATTFRFNFEQVAVNKYFDGYFFYNFF